MRQYKETFHVLQYRKKIVSNEWSIWMPTQGGFLRSAESLAWSGRLMEAIEEAERAHACSAQVRESVEYRVLTNEKTITASTALNDGWKSL